jgi:hypothetical protein
MGSFHAAGAGFYTSSPVVYKGKLYIDTATVSFMQLTLPRESSRWQYPPPASPALDSKVSLEPFEQWQP